MRDRSRLLIQGFTQTRLAFRDVRLWEGRLQAARTIVLWTTSSGKEFEAPLVNPQISTTARYRR